MKTENILPYKMNLQFFADEGGNDNPQGNEGNPDDQQQNNEEKIVLTAEELQRKIDSETDRKLEKALKTARANWEKEFQEKLEQEKREAERLAKLSEKERKEEELRKREEELERRLREIERKELKADAIGVLTAKQLPTQFVDFLLGENAEKTLENINAFKEAFDKAVEEKVKEALAGTPPKKNPTQNTGITKEQFNQMNYKERVKLYNENLELYKKLSGGN